MCVLPLSFFLKMVKDEKSVEVVDVPMSFEKKIKTEEGEIGIEEALVIIMNDIKEIKKSIL